MKNTLAERLRQLLQIRGMTQKHLSKAAGLTESTISNYVNGNRNPGYENIVKIANVLDVPAEYFLVEESAKSEQVKMAVEIIKNNISYITPEMSAELTDLLSKS